MPQILSRFVKDTFASNLKLGRHLGLIVTAFFFYSFFGWKKQQLPDPSGALKALAHFDFTPKKVFNCTSRSFHQVIRTVHICRRSSQKIFNRHSNSIGLNNKFSEIQRFKVVFLEQKKRHKFKKQSKVDFYWFQVMETLLQVWKTELCLVNVVDNYFGEKFKHVHEHTCSFAWKLYFFLLHQICATNEDHEGGNHMSFP